MFISHCIVVVFHSSAEFSRWNCISRVSRLMLFCFSQYVRATSESRVTRSSRTRRTRGKAAGATASPSNTGSASRSARTERRRTPTIRVRRRGSPGIPCTGSRSQRVNRCKKQSVRYKMVLAVAELLGIAVNDFDEKKSFFTAGCLL